MYKPGDLERVQKEEEENDVGRSAFRRDYGRLLHSASFRRLQGKTQLFPGHESDFFRNRLTHSLEVAQIAKGIAQQINTTDGRFKGENAIDLDLVEFAALAHDLGHPPFGHNGERALDDCMKQHGGFEGNAQTLRIVSRVEKKVYDTQAGSGDDPCPIAEDGRDLRLGLNLTFRSLAAVLKYDSLIPAQRSEGEKLCKGYYVSEKDLVEKVKASVGKPPEGRPFKTIECQVMDIADDIAYSTYDLEDAMKGGFTHPLDLLAQVGDEKLLDEITAKTKREVSDVAREEVFQALVDLLQLYEDNSTPIEAYVQSKMVASSSVLRSKFTSELVGGFMRGVSVGPSDPEGLTFASLSVERGTRIKIEALKHLNYLLTIMSPRLKVVEYRGYDVVQTLFATLTSSQGPLLLPDDVKEAYSRLQDAGARHRLVCDFVAGMTDRYAVEFYARLKESGATIFKPL
nr:dNTP triphosphohydrolase [Ramlibacter alkalitolerans]